jgi:hypothetical protein
MLRELEQVARRAHAVKNNAAVIRETQAKVKGAVDRTTILAACTTDATIDGRGRQRDRSARSHGHTGDVGAGVFFSVPSRVAVS